MARVPYSSLATRLRQDHYLENFYYLEGLQYHPGPDTGDARLTSSLHLALDPERTELDSRRGNDSSDNNQFVSVHGSRNTVIS